MGNGGHPPRLALSTCRLRSMAAHCRVHHRSRLSPPGPCRAGTWSISPVRRCGMRPHATAGSSLDVPRGT
eukprot:8634908-Lingulodinium_polyedra.AAC.1